MLNANLSLDLDLDKLKGPRHFQMPVLLKNRGKMNYKILMLLLQSSELDGSFWAHRFKFSWIETFIQETQKNGPLFVYESCTANVHHCFCHLHISRILCYALNHAPLRFVSCKWSPTPSTLLSLVFFAPGRFSISHFNTRSEYLALACQKIRLLC